MKALITGITGFVGSYLAEYLLTEGIDVYGFVRWRSPTNHIKNILDKITLYQGDLLDVGSIERCLMNCKPDYIFHLAAQSYVPYSFDAPASTLDVNGIGTCNLLEVVRQRRRRSTALSGGYDFNPIIHVCSSSEVYGQVTKKDIPITEDCPLRPASPYGVSKVTEDLIAQNYWETFGVKAIRTRMFTHTGPRRGGVFVVSDFCKQIALIEAGKQEPVVNVGNLNSVRTFADVRDAVRAYWLLVNKCLPGTVYNIGGNTTMTIGEMLYKLIDMSVVKDITIRIDSARLRPKDVTLQIPCVDRFKKDTGWEPKIPFNKTLKDTLDYWREVVNG